ncbi:efflux RND transporter periplasmic adaptor subunit [soil metagenome]
MTATTAATAMPQSTPRDRAPLHALALVAAAAVVAALGLLGACSDRSAVAAVQPEAPAPSVQGNQIRYAPNHPQLAMLGVTAAVPSRATHVELPARLVWNEERTQRIYPAFAGRVSAIEADVGGRVKRGGTLAQLASPDFGIAQADTAKAQADARLSNANLQRQRELFEAGIVARKDLEQAEAEAARARAEVSRAGARTAMYGGAKGGVDQRLAIVSGIDGVVVERNLNPGQELRPEQSGAGVPALFVLSDPTSLWVQIDARESEVGTLQPGTVFTLTTSGLPGQTFEGRVTAAADYIDPLSRTIKVRGVVANPDRKLKAEMLATAQFERAPGNGVTVPASAVLLRGARHSVLVQVEPGVFEPREVQIGWSGSREVMLSRGLAVGEKVVSDNTLLLARQLRLAQDVALATADGKP